MFFGASGSIAGGQIEAVGRASATGTCWRRWKMAASWARVKAARTRARSRSAPRGRCSRRQVEVAADVASMLDDADRLRVVNDHEIVGHVERIGIHQLVSLEDLLLLRREAVGIALQGVVDRLRDVGRPGPG